jgi:hypothetical protein
MLNGNDHTTFYEVLKNVLLSGLHRNAIISIDALNLWDASARVCFLRCTWTHLWDTLERSCLLKYIWTQLWNAFERSCLLSRRYFSTIKIEVDFLKVSRRIILITWKFLHAERVSNYFIWINNSIIKKKIFFSKHGLSSYNKEY